MSSVRKKIAAVAEQNLLVGATINSYYLDGDQALPNSYLLERTLLSATDEALLTKAEILKTQIDTLIKANEKLVAALEESKCDEDLYANLYVQNIAAINMLKKAQDLAEDVSLQVAGVSEQYKILLAAISSPIATAPRHHDTYDLSPEDVRLPWEKLQLKMFKQFFQKSINRPAVSSTSHSSLEAISPFYQFMISPGIGSLFMFGKSLLSQCRKIKQTNAVPPITLSNSIK